jgi:hypothetical protein
VKEAGGSAGKNLVEKDTHAASDVETADTSVDSTSDVETVDAPVDPSVDVWGISCWHGLDPG